MHIMYIYLCEGVEKSNDDAKKLYFRQSNQWNVQRIVYIQNNSSDIKLTTIYCAYIILHDE